MDAAQCLLRYVRRKQFLIYAFCLEESGTPIALRMADITVALQINAAECLGLVHRLQAKGLIEPAPDAGPGCLRLTARGQALVQRMARAAGTENQLAVAPETLLDAAPRVTAQVAQVGA